MVLHQEDRQLIPPMDASDEIAQFAEIYDIGVNWLMGEGAERLDPQSDRLQLAFRELQKLKADDLDKLMKVLAALREDKGGA